MPMTSPGSSVRSRKRNSRWLNRNRLNACHLAPCSGAAPAATKPPKAPTSLRRRRRIRRLKTRRSRRVRPSVLRRPPLHLRPSYAAGPPSPRPSFTRKRRHPSPHRRRPRVARKSEPRIQVGGAAACTGTRSRRTARARSPGACRSRAARRRRAAYRTCRAGACAGRRRAGPRTSSGASARGRDRGRSGPGAVALARHRRRSAARRSHGERVVVVIVVARA